MTAVQYLNALDLSSVETAVQVVVAASVAVAVTFAGFRLVKRLLTAMMGGR